MTKMRPALLLCALTLVPMVAQAEEKTGGLPQMNPEWFPSQVFWLAVHFFALYMVAAKLILPNLAKTLETRESQIAADMLAARRVGQDARDAEDTSEAALAAARAKANAAREATMAEGKAARLKAEQEQSTTLVKRIEEAHDRLEQANAALRSRIRDVAAETTQDIVQKLTGTAVDRIHVDSALECILNTDTRKVA